MLVQKKINSIRNDILIIILIIIVLVIFFLIYYTYFDVPVATVGSSNVATPALIQENFSIDVVSDGRYKNLESYGEVPVVVDNKGVANPFLENNN